MNKRDQGGTTGRNTLAVLGVALTDGVSPLQHRMASTDSVADVFAASITPILSTGARTTRTASEKPTRMSAAQHDHHCGRGSIRGKRTMEGNKEWQGREGARDGNRGRVVKQRWSEARVVNKADTLQRAYAAPSAHASTCKGAQGAECGKVRSRVRFCTNKMAGVDAPFAVE